MAWVEGRRGRVGTSGCANSRRYTSLHRADKAGQRLARKCRRLYTLWLDAYGGRTAPAAEQREGGLVAHPGRAAAGAAASAGDNRWNMLRGPAGTHSDGGSGADVFSTAAAGAVTVVGQGGSGGKVIVICNGGPRAGCRNKREADQEVRAAEAWVSRLAHSTGRRAGEGGESESESELRTDHEQQPCRRIASHRREPCARDSSALAEACWRSSSSMMGLGTLIALIALIDPARTDVSRRPGQHQHRHQHQQAPGTSAAETPGTPSSRAEQSRASIHPHTAAQHPAHSSMAGPVALHLGRTAAALRPKHGSRMSGAGSVSVCTTLGLAIPPLDAQWPCTLRLVLHNTPMAAASRTFATLLLQCQKRLCRRRTSRAPRACTWLYAWAIASWK